jgi:hypothetical protein
MNTPRRILAACVAASLVSIVDPLGPAPLAAQARSGDDRFLGNWQGALQVSGLSLRLALTFERDPAGKLGGTLTSIDQGGAKLPMEVTVAGDSVRAGLARIQAAFAGRLNSAGDSIDGAWTQAGTTLPLRLGKVAAVAALVRPQEPKPPFPYRAEEVAFDSEEGVKLAGTLTLPQGAGPFPAVVLVTGSGPQDRDESLLGHRPFLVLADHLTRRGIAVLRYDDRGFGKSTGSFAAATSEDFAEDALAGVRFLRARRDIGRVGIAGHSEGGLVAPLAAVRSDDVAFLVLLAGTGLPGDSILKLQGRLIARANGVSADLVDASARAQARMFAVIKAGGDSAAMVARLSEIGRAMVDSLSEEQRREAQVDPASMERNIRQLVSPWFRYFLAYDPRPTLRRVKVPVLAVNGGLDLQVPPKENLAAIEAALREGGNRDVRVVELPGLNHLFQTTTTGAPSEYGTIEETMSPAVLNAVSGWILERFGPGR